MTFEIHKKDSRGHANFGWLQANYSFSFANHYDPERMGFGDLLVLNDDIIAANRGFPEHPHKDMEIISIPIKGALAHDDSTGANDTVVAGEVQAMSAGTGILHSEYNPSETNDTHSLQLWIKPHTRNVTPKYDKKSFPLEKNTFITIVSGDKQEEKALFIYQDAKIKRAIIEKQYSLSYIIPEGFGVYIFVISGRARILGQELLSRDAIAIHGEQEIPIEGIDEADILCIETRID